MAMCTSICRFNVPFCVNSLWQIVHWNGFSPVCIRLCIRRDELEGNIRPHISHLLNRTPSNVSPPSLPMAEVYKREVISTTLVKRKGDAIC